MIQITLVPDVKQELIRAQRQRATVISIAILASLGAIALVTVLAIYVFGIQGIRSSFSDNNIKSESAKLAKYEDLSNTLTIQNQLAVLSGLHADKQMTSRIFDILATIDPPAPNNMTIANVSLATESKTITIEGYATAGYSALETFKKTIESTTIHFTEDGNAQQVDLAEKVDIGETSYGENSDGNRVLRFVMSFVYTDEVFSREAVATKIVAPDRENATDSYRRLPQSLFGAQAEDIKEDN